MALDKSLASLFAEQKLRIQARKDEKNKLQKEKALRRDFQIRVSPGPALPLTTPLPLPSPQRLAELTLLTTGPRPDRGAGDQAAREPPGPGAARAAAARHPAEHAQQQQRQAGAGPAAQDGPHLHVRAAGLPDGGVGARGPHHSGAFTHLFLQCLAQGPQSHRRPQGHCSWESRLGAQLGQAGAVAASGQETEPLTKVLRDRGRRPGRGVSSAGGRRARSSAQRPQAEQEGVSDTVRHKQLVARRPQC